MGARQVRGLTQFCEDFAAIETPSTIVYTLETWDLSKDFQHSRDGCPWLRRPTQMGEKLPLEWRTEFARPGNDVVSRCGAMVSEGYVPVAQLDRASASGAEGYKFESCRGYFT